MIEQLPKAGITTYDNTIADQASHIYGRLDVSPIGPPL